MGNCIYCGQPAGFLRSRHSECQDKHSDALRRMLDKARTAALGESPLETLEPQLKVMAQQGYVSDASVKGVLVQGWEQAVLHFLEDGNLNAQEENDLTAYARHFSLTQDDLDKTGAYTKFVQGAVLREVMEGKVPQRVSFAEQLPLNFQKSESLVWVFPGVSYYERRTRREYVGGSHGVSVRVTRGVYYRVGGFKGRPVETEEVVLVDKGLIAITTKHIYFHGPSKSFRIPYTKLVSYTPYSDGIAVQRDAASAKPQVFVTGDGWFIYNLIANLTQMH